MKFSTTIALTSFVAGQVAATGWLNANSYNCPSSADNTCNTQQKTGFDWSSLPAGGFSSYGQFDFKGFSCQNKFGKRHLLRRDFQNKCITGKVSKSSGPSFSCSQKQGFSVDHYHVSVDVDTDLEFHHEMPDGSVCKQKASCKTGGTIVKNSQCGGAKAVTVQLPQGSKSNGCNVGIHSVGFNCDTSPKPSVYQPSPTPSPSSIIKISSTSVPVVITTTTTSSVVSIPTSVLIVSSSTSSQVSIPSSTSTSSSFSTIILISSSTVAPVVPTTSLPSFSLSISSPIRVPSPPVYVPPVYINSTIVAPVVPTTTSSDIPVLTTSSISSVVLVSSSSTPVSPEIPSSSSSSTPVSPELPSSVSSAILYSSTSISTVVRPSSVGPAPPGPSAPCPEVLPKCLNTWMHQTGCKDNTDHTCFCKDSKFSDNVIECVQSWGADSAEMQKALSYFVGICAKFVPQNPGLITKCPKDLPITPPPMPIVRASSTIETISTTVLVTDVVTTCPPGKTITNDAGQTTVYKVAVTSTIRQTVTSTICTRCLVGPTPQVQIPVTTVLVQDVYTVPCTYSTGVSAGFEIPGSSTTTSLSTAVTVPQVQFSTFQNDVASPAVDLYPATVVAPVVAGNAPAGAAATATYSAAKSTGTAAGGITQFTGAADHKAASFGTLAMGAAVAAYFVL